MLTIIIGLVLAMGLIAMAMMFFKTPPEKPGSAPAVSEVPAPKSKKDTKKENKKEKKQSSPKPKKEFSAVELAKIVGGKDEKVDDMKLQTTADKPKGKNVRNRGANAEEQGGPDMPTSKQIKSLQKQGFTTKVAPKKKELTPEQIQQREDERKAEEAEVAKRAEKRKQDKEAKDKKAQEAKDKESQVVGEDEGKSQAKSQAQLNAEIEKLLAKQRAEKEAKKNKPVAGAGGQVRRNVLTPAEGGTGKGWDAPGETDGYVAVDAPEGDEGQQFSPEEFPGLGN